jgi:UDP-N-acetylglucosamine 1-carboxyvinyltransferase
MAAATANGTTVIYNAAREPEIVQLCEFLNKMGASISGIDSETLIIDGVNRLHPTDIKVIPDRIEIGTFLIAGALLGGITVKDIEIDHLDTVLGKLKDVGCKISIGESSITLEPPDKIKPIDMATAVYPGFPTDLQAQWVALMSLADGSSTIKDTVYHDRFSHIPELARLGANIQVNHNTAFVRGVDSLVGAPVMSTDIRASASLIIAGLAASGETEVSRVYHIDRGYERIEEKFRCLGANISREHG